MSYVKKMVFYFFKRMIRLFDLIVPKKKNLIVYGCKADRYYDNARYFFEFMRNNHSEYESVWLTKDKQVCNKIRNRFGEDSCKTFFSIKGIWTFLRARTAILSHGSIDFFYFLSSFSPKLIVNLWHGQPLKAIGYLSREFQGNKRKKITERYDLLAVSSRIESYVMKACFDSSVKKMMITGYPRNDVLLKNLEKNVQDEINLFVKRFNLPFVPEQVILYAPTYRKNSIAQFFPFKDLDFDRFDKIMKENKAILILRGHVNDILKDKTKTSELESSIQKIIDSKWSLVLHQTDLEDINDILHIVNLLITDYSSIYFDYLLVDRPIFFIPYDLDEYEKTNGIVYPYDSVTPGEKIYSGKEFVEKLSEFFKGVDNYKEKRRWIKKLFLEIQVPEASENILNQIKKELK